MQCLSQREIVATLDLHCNISDEMENAVDLMIGYRTNPHVDLYERGVEAAGALREMMAGLRPKSYRVRLPLVAPSVTQLTADGYPYGDLIKRGQAMIDSNSTSMVATIIAPCARAEERYLWPYNGH